MNRILRLRCEIDQVDQDILHLLSKRANVCRRVGEAKRKAGAPLRDVAREKQEFARVAERARKLGLDPDDVKAVYRKIIGMCLKAQETDSVESSSC